MSKISRRDMLALLGLPPAAVLLGGWGRSDYEFLLNIARNAGGAAPAHQFSFVSTGTNYVGRTCAASGTPTVAWTIEGTVYPTLNPGTVTFASTKTVMFDITPKVNLTQWRCENNSLTGTLPSLTPYTSLINLQFHQNAFTGSLPDTTGLASLTGVVGYLNQCSGNIPDFSTNTSLASYDVGDNKLTGVATGFAVPAVLKTFAAANNLLSQAAVDAILHAFVLAGATGGSLNLGGTGNSTPSAAGLADKATLQGRVPAWTVTTN
jgi:hypothetical protein